jgi:GntR family transcriptional regulator/MocR family aminotransferase
MEFHVSLIGRKNLSIEIYRQLRRAIIDGVLGPGDLLPPSRELARRLSVSRTTVTVAYDRLAGEGYVTSRVGAGTTVSFRQAASGDREKRKPTGALRPRPFWDSVRLPDTFEHAPRFPFITGMPDASLFPHQTWRRLIARELRSPEVSGGAYGEAAGHPGLRAAIARHIAISRGVETSPEDITITNGTQQALDIIARVMLAPGETVAVEDPGYQPPLRLFRSLGARVTGVPVDAEGLVVDALPRNARFVYVTPSHQYPLGVTMSMPRRQALLNWADRANAAIIEDDYDSEFRFGGRPMEPLHTLDTTGRVVYIGSFSKTMLPTLRLGFVATPPSLSAAAHKAKHVTDWHTNVLVQAALARFIDEGDFARHVRKLGSVYRARHELILKILARDFADCLEGIPSTVGLHVTARSHHVSIEDIDSLRRRAFGEGVAFHRLSRFAIDGPEQAGVVLGYGAIAMGDIEEGLRRLRACFDG